MLIVYSHICTCTCTYVHSILHCIRKNIYKYASVYSSYVMSVYLKISTITCYTMICIHLYLSFHFKIAYGNNVQSNSHTLYVISKLYPHVHATHNDM